MQREPQKKTKKRDNGQAFCLWLILFMIFEVVLVIVVLTRTFKTADKPVETPSGEETTTDSEQPGDPVPSVPVFAGGTVPTLPAATSSTQTLTGISSQYAVLVNAETGEIVASKNADTKFSPASLTKVMSLIVACEHLTQDDLNRKLVLTQEITDYVKSGNYADASVALIDGDKYLNDEFLIRDLLYGIGVSSAADCTYMIALEVSGSETAFVDLMNRKAAEMGLTNTHFDNAIGYDSVENYTTASEMAAIMAYAMQCNLIKDILAVREYYNYQGYYTENGVEKSYNRGFTSTFQSRLNSYSSFRLTTVNLSAQKTGYTTSSYIVCAATGLQSKEQYILVLGDAEKLKGTMTDIETVYNTYAK
ncbi:MAG: D-alanyl-D-alanine carboxypeptidase [Clostridia bacterium]|nr:D-alanyl-D-alanine carboxypeptidase [Clostridia bacterium]